MPLTDAPQAVTTSVFVIIPVHNRKALTLACLNHLSAQGAIEAFQVIVVDDGSTDGTAQAIRAKYPQILILEGDGNLWWTGAIRLGMEYAYSLGADYIVWLNDDTLPAPGAIELLITRCSQENPCAISAQCYSDSSFIHPTYGGQCRKHLSHRPVIPPSGGEIDCDTLSGNLTCIPRSAIQYVGFPNANQLPHYQGDTVYTWQLKRAGFQIVVTDQARAICPKNSDEVSWLTSDEPVVSLWKKLASPKSPFYVPAFWHFCTCLWGLSGIWVFIQPYSRLFLISLLKWIFPKSLLKQLATVRL